MPLTTRYRAPLVNIEPPNTPHRTPRSRMTMRQKVDDITEYMRKTHYLTPGEYLLGRMTLAAEDGSTSRLSPEEWSKRIVMTISDGGLDMVHEYAVAGVELDALSPKTVMQEMDALYEKGVRGNMFGTWSHKTQPDLRNLVDQAHKKAPTLMKFMRKCCAPRRNPPSARGDQIRDIRAAILISFMCNQAARNSSNYTIHLIGTNLYGLGLQKRGIEFLSSLGLSPTYKVLRKDRENTIKDSQASTTILHASNNLV